MNVIYKIAVLPRHLILLLVSSVFQLFFFNFLAISEYIFICFYLLFIITLPIRIKKIVLLLICFAYGVILDLLNGSGGIYAMTTTFIGFVRPAILRLFFVKDERYRHTLPISKDMGGFSFAIYAFIVLFIATMFYAIVESFTFQSIGFMLYKSFLSAIITLPIIYLTQMLLLGYKESR